MSKRNGLKIVKKVQKPKHPTNVGKKGFVMDRKTYLNWYDY